MKKIVIILCIIAPMIIQAQNCDCESNFNWVKKTFEENDAGFTYALENKGVQSYEKHNEIFLEKVKSIENSTECTKVLYEWLTFFRSGHIVIKRIENEKTEQKDCNIIEQFKNWEREDVDLNKFEKYLNNKKVVDYEGIWETPPYKIAIKKQGNIYKGYIIEGDGIYWTQGQLKLKINANEKEITSTYYMKDHSMRVFENADLLGNNYLQMGFTTLKRISPQLELNKTIDRYFRLMSTPKPYFEQLNKNTTLLRIPTFSHTQKGLIDSIIVNNKEHIFAKENLIIDLRNNGGGSDASFQELIPLIYTNPIRTVSVEFLSTKLNNQRLLDWINNSSVDEENKKWIKMLYDKLSKNIGEFVYLDTTVINDTVHLDTVAVDIQEMDTTYSYPKNVAIIINEGNSSTTEQFLLAAKQSRKVKLFGIHTFGSLDISNMNFVSSPCGEFQLGYCLSKSLRIPEMAIDDKGIPPDYYIDKSIPKYGWIDFVINVLGEK